MEQRKYHVLKEVIENIYDSKNKLSLRQKVYKNKRGQICVNENTPCEPPIIYGNGKLNEHQIELRVPGRLTYKHRITGELMDDIQRFDIRIRLKNKNSDDFATPSHIELVEDLYYKIASSDENERDNTYSLYATILKNIYYDNEPLYKTGLSQKLIYDNSYSGYSLPELISFIKWCSLQEDLNFNPINLFGKDDWGKDLLFARYFEAIKAGFNQDEDLLNEVIERTNNHGKGKPELWDREVYHGTLITRF